MSGAALLERLRTDRRAPWVALAAGTLVLVVIAGWFWYTHRRGYPMLTDEGLYTSLSLDDGRVLYEQGLSGLWDFYRAQVRTAPLIPLLTLPAQFVLGPSIAGGFVTVIALYGLLIPASYAVARRLMSPWWAVFAALMVGVTPEIVQWGRMFYFAVPATVFFVGAIACLLWSDGSTRRWWTIAGGILLGFAVLSRTMMLGFVAGPALAAVVQAMAQSWGRGTDLGRRAVNLVLAFAAGAALAATWYWGHLNEVTEYLTDRTARITGSAQSGKGVGRGWREINQLVDTLYLPLAVLLLVVVVVWATWTVLALWPRSQGEASPEQGERPASDQRSEPESASTGASAEVSTWWRTALTGDALFLVIVFAAGFVLLVWADNALAQWVPVLPVAVILGVAAVAALPAGVPRTVLAGALAVLGIANLAMLNDVSSTLGEQRVVKLGPIGGVTVTDGRQVLQSQLDRRDQESGTPGSFPASYRDFAAQQRQLAEFMRDHAASIGERPIVFAHVDDVHPLFSIVDLRMADQLNREPGFPVGVIDPAGRDNVENIRASLNNPETGVPNFVVSTPDDDFGIENPDIEIALDEEGYEVVRELTLPDGSLVRLWFRPIQEADLPGT